MAEYIEREVATNVACNILWKMNSPSTSVMAKALNSIPAADVAPVRHGKWMNANSRPKTYERRCTACGGRAYFCGMGCSYKYCPNCGAKMEEGAE